MRPLVWHEYQYQGERGDIPQDFYGRYYKQHGRVSNHSVYLGGKIRIRKKK